MPNSFRQADQGGRQAVFRRIGRFLVKAIPIVLTDATGGLVNKLRARRLKREIEGQATDLFLELLLTGMDWAFCLVKGYRKNIEGFEGRYLFRTAGELVVSSAVFQGGEMFVKQGSITDWDVRVTFKNVTALREFLFSRDQDILNSLLANEVEIDGNLNYIYKFGFMARDLAHRLGVR